MRILKDNSKKNITLTCKCHECTSVLEVTREDLTGPTADRDGPYFTFVCPVCQNKNFLDASLVD